MPTKNWQELKSHKKKIDFILKSHEDNTKINKLEDLIESKHISKYTSYIIDFKYNKSKSLFLFFFLKV